MIKLSVYVAILVVLGIVWLVQQAQAHGRRPDPLMFRPVLGPIEHLYPVGIRNGSEVMAQAAQHVAGMSVASVSGDVVLLNSRPNVGRLDDGMGMLLRVTSWYLPDGWHVRIEGQPKASLAADASSRRGFVAVERQLRQSLAHMGYRLDDGLSDLAQPRAALPAPASVGPQWAPPVEPPPPPALSLSLLSAHGAVPHAVMSVVAIGRDPVAPATSGSSTLLVADPLASKTHALVGWDGSRAWLEDQGSTNGTLIESLNATRVAPAGGRAALENADTLVIGEHRLVVQIGVH